MEEEFKWPSPLEMARDRWETLKEMLANPEDFDDIYFLAEVSEFPILLDQLHRAYPENPEEVRAIVREICERKEELKRVLGLEVREALLPGGCEEEGGSPQGSSS
jgi:tRNA U34 5-methylaminomethyl-2-thiouridine-forming methyltransferase MnmC